jgi:hypothetical protein
MLQLGVVQCRLLKENPAPHLAANRTKILPQKYSVQLLSEMFTALKYLMCQHSCVILRLPLFCQYFCAQTYVV